jgi:putative aldouronate transport system substrate-binding protein
MKQYLILALTSALLLSTGGCAQHSEATAGKNTVSATIMDRGAIPISEGTYEDNRWTRWIDENSGIDVSWVPIPRNESRQTINMLVTLDEAPDIIVEFDAALFKSLIIRGALMPLDQYIEQYAPKYKEYLDGHPALKEYTTYNGETYLITTERSWDMILNNGAWIRQDWLDKLGLEIPETDEELLEVARAFRDGDPDGNGVDDTTAFSMAFWYNTIPQLYQAGNQWYIEDGNLKYGHTLDRYGEAIRFLKTCYDEGLVDKEFVNDKDHEFQKKLWEDGKSGIYIGSWTGAWNEGLLENNPAANPVALKPVATQFGLNSFYKEALPALYVGFNKNIENPESAMKLVEWMFTEGWFTIRNGVEGVHYKMENGIPKELDREKKRKEVDYAGEYAFVNNWDPKTNWIIETAAEDEISQRLAMQKLQSKEVNESVPFRRDLAVDPQLESVVSVLNEFEPLRDEIRIKMIMGGADYTIEQGMEDIRREWERIGGLEAEREMNEWYKNNK